MTWITVICLAAALGWTAISFAAYSDMDLVFRSSLVAWLVCGAVWLVGRLDLSPFFTRRKGSAKLKLFTRYRLALAGAVAGVAALAVLSGQWLGKGNGAGDLGFRTGLGSGTESPSTERKLTAKERSKADAEEGLWTVQVAAFTSERHAVNLAEALKGKGYEAYVMSGDFNVYRTKVGRFRTRQEAEKLLLILKDREDYKTAFIVGM
jgi:hypothetical protein